MAYQVDQTAVVDAGCEIGEGTRIWHFSHIMQGSRIGERCNIGQNVVVSPGVVLGNGVKVQNNVSIYTGVTCEDDVFLGPSCVFTNVINPRSAIVRKDQFRKTRVERGASIGANATIVCGHTIGRYAMVGAGAVVTKDVALRSKPKLGAVNKKGTAKKGTKVKIVKLNGNWGLTDNGYWISLEKVKEI